MIGMSKRDILDEILAKKERIGHRELRAATGLIQIKESLDGGLSDPVAMSLNVVAVVACIEVAARDAIALLIDSGPPYVDRVGDVLKNESRFTLDVVRAFQDRRVSLGEFVSHLLPISSLAHIMGYFDVLLGEPFRNVLASLSIGERYGSGAEHQQARERPRIVPDVELMMRALADAFAVRHVVAHEAGFSAVTADSVRNYLSQAILFDNALYHYVREVTDVTTYHFVWADTLESCMRAKHSIDTVGGVCNHLQTLLESGHYGRADSNAALLLQQAQAAFEQYAAAEVDFQLALKTPPTGHAYRNVEAYVEKQLNDQRADVLLEALNDAFGWVELVKLRGGA